MQTPSNPKFFATATPAQLAAAGFTRTLLPSQARRKRRSRLGVKPSANKKGAARKTIGQANEPGRGTMRNN